MTIESERIAWLNMAGPMTLDNIRYRQLLPIFTDRNGAWYEAFAVPFDTTCISVDAVIVATGNTVAFGLYGITSAGFNIIIRNSTSGAVIDSPNFKMYYFAVGY